MAAGDPTSDEPTERRPSQRRGHERRDAIVEAAVRRFATHGFRGTSVAAVAEDAGIKDASLLYWFPTKANLLLAVLAHHDRERGRILDQMLEPGGRTALERFAGWGAVMETDPDLTALHVTLSGEHLRDDSDVQRYFEERYERSIARLRSTIAEGVDRGEFAPCDAEVEAEQLLAMLDGLRLQWFFVPGASLADGVRRHIEQVLERLSIT